MDLEIEREGRQRGGGSTAGVRAQAVRTQAGGKESGMNAQLCGSM